MGFIDADTHVVETERVWEFLDADAIAFRPTTFVRHGAGTDNRSNSVWLVDGDSYPRGGIEGENYAPGTRDIADLERRIADMDRLGVDIQVVIPSIFLGASFRRAETELALARGYNRFMADISIRSGGRLRWVVVPALQSIDDTVDELRYGKKNGACGVLFRGNERGRLLTDPCFFPVYQAANDLNLPICVHVGNGNPAISAQRELINHPFSTSNLPAVGAFHAILLSDVPSRFPDLRFGFLEAGAGWVPYALHQARRFLDRRRPGHKLPDQPLKAQRLYVAAEADDDLPYILQHTGPDNVMLGTDYGHSDVGTELEGHANLLRRSDVNPDVLRRIVDSNAREFYGI